MVLNRLHFFITAVLLSAFYTMNNNGWSSSPGLKTINLGTKQGATGDEVSAEYFSSNLHSSWS